MGRADGLRGLPVALPRDVLAAAGRFRRLDDRCPGRRFLTHGFRHLLLHRRGSVSCSLACPSGHAARARRVTESSATAPYPTGSTSPIATNPVPTIFADSAAIHAADRACSRRYTNRCSPLNSSEALLSLREMNRAFSRTPEGSTGRLAGAAAMVSAPFQ